MSKSWPQVILSCFLALALTCPITGCVVVPKMDGVANVSLSDIAWRVKCDIWKVVARKMHEFPTDRRHIKDNPYAFLQGWGAKVHLTLGVDDTAAFNPGATLIEPLASAQSRSLGLGAGISTEAVSTTDYEFFLSFAELNDQYRKSPPNEIVEHYCLRPSSGLLLDSDLKLDDLFDRALDPVKYQILTVGAHPGFAGSTPPATPADQIPDYDELQKLFQQLKNQRPGEAQKLNNDAVSRIQEQSRSKGLAIPSADDLNDQHIIDDNKQAALQQETLSQTYVNNIIKPVTDVLAASYPACVKSVTQSRNKAIIQAALVSSERIEVDRATTASDSTKAIKALSSKMDELQSTAGAVIDDLKTCPKLTEKPTTQVYDPLDLVSQTINFYITSSGSVTPMWKLVRVTAPLASTFASLNRKDTNTLIIAFGRPDLSKANSSSTAVSNQILTSTLRDALSSPH